MTSDVVHHFMTAGHLYIFISWMFIPFSLKSENSLNTLGILRTRPLSDTRLANTVSCLSFFKKIIYLFYFKGIQRQKTEIILPFAGSIAKVPQQLGWVRPNPGAQNSIWDSHKSGKDPIPDHHLLPPRVHTSRKLDWKQGSQESNTVLWSKIQTFQVSTQLLCHTPVPPSWQSPWMHQCF